MANENKMKHSEETIKAAEEFTLRNSPVICEERVKAAFIAGYEHAQNDIQELVEALENLMCAQNGPPLIREQEYWQQCMDKANELIQKHRR